MTSETKVDLKGLQGIAKNALGNAQRAVKHLADETVALLKKNAPIASGALKESITAKLVTERAFAYAIVGSDVGYMMSYNNITKEPYEYAAKEDELMRFISGNVPRVDDLAGLIKKEFSNGNS